MDAVSGMIRGNLTMLIALVIALLIVYAVYSYLYAPDDSTYVQFLRGEADARSPITLNNWKVPTIYTGGDFTFSFWIFIDDWNYRASAYKFLFAISPAALGGSNPLVGLLTPLQNGLMVRASTVNSGGTPAPGSSSSGVSGPDVTVEANLQNLLDQQTSMNMFSSTLDTPCDVKSVVLQRWTNVTIVSSGRILDVYMDGKLARSCVLDNVVNVPRTQLKLRLGENGGFGGRYSSVQMWNQQLTPDVIYGIYQMGPTQNTHSIFTDIAKMLGINVTYLSSTGVHGASCDPQTITGSGALPPASTGQNTWTQDATALMARL
jgi:hypothetical protein